MPSENNFTRRRVDLQCTRGRPRLPSCLSGHSWPEVPFRPWPTKTWWAAACHPKGRNEVEEPRSGLTGCRPPRTRHRRPARAAHRGTRSRACAHAGKNGVSRGCTTRLPNTHSTAERRVLYEFHPWFGRQVAVDDVFVRAGISVARCRPPGEVQGHLVEVPLWMFDRQSCSVVRRRERPHVDLTALEALSDMLSLSGGGDGGDSAVGPAAAGWDADLQSRDSSQGANHAPIPSEARAAGPVRPPSGSQPPETPPWCSLPQGTRRRATVLVARMLLQHRASQSAEPGAANIGEGSDV